MAASSRVDRWMDGVLLGALVTLADGAHEWNRTIDLLLTKEVLYRLSYVSVETRVTLWF
jgi:hypothetical protein